MLAGVAALAVVAAKLVHGTRTPSPPPPDPLGGRWARSAGAQRSHAAVLGDLGSLADAVAPGEPARVTGASAPGSTRSARARGRELTTSARSRPRNSSAGAVVDRPARRDRFRRATAWRKTGSRAGSPSAVHGQRAGQQAEAAAPGAGAPSDVEMPHSNQHIAPADSPASTTPASQHSRRIASRPSARQTASRPSIEPPPT